MFFQQRVSTIVSLERARARIIAHPNYTNKYTHLSPMQQSTRRSDCIFNLEIHGSLVNCVLASTRSTNFHMGTRGSHSHAYRPRRSYWHVQCNFPVFFSTYRISIFADAFELAPMSVTDELRTGDSHYARSYVTVGDPTPAEKTLAGKPPSSPFPL